ncbi:uncharacterized protein EDB93DRAFT_1246878 [Suillus bovinus]|uniref:uncharacterized protein n=1 Tax=Suillus bovinus TaxID=48563 RepID=UPI001B85C8B6|nr:uncharacterized protein EDB93DRAFT_1246878 [Suillus bovinus]KAG2157831.1 hypothetical protein EDB93DRAFT_1246878 [Suillus bovinus]
MTLSTAMTITVRVAVTGFLSVSCFRRVVVDNTAQVLSKAENASAGLAVYSVCLSTITLVLAADKAAQRLLSNEPKHMLATSKNANADFNPPSAHDVTASVTPQPVESSHLQPFPSPSQLRLIESAGTISAPFSTCMPNEKTTVKPYNLQPSPLLRLIESTETTSASTTYSNICTPCITLTSPDLYCKRLSIDSSTTLVPHNDDSVPDVFSDDGAWDADDYNSESLQVSDKSTVHKDDRSKPQPQKDPALEHVLDILIAKMTALTLDDPPRPSKLRPLILVNRHKTFSLSDSPSTDPGVALPGPGYPIDVPTQIMEALSLAHRPSSTSKLKPLILVTKLANPRFKLPLTTTVLRQPRSKTTVRSQTYWPFSLNPAICAHPQPGSPTTNLDNGLLLSPTTRSFTAQEVEGHFQSTHTTRHESPTIEVPYDPILTTN